MRFIYLFLFVLTITANQAIADISRNTVLEYRISGYNSTSGFTYEATRELIVDEIGQLSGREFGYVRTGSLGGVCGEGDISGQVNGNLLSITKVLTGEDSPGCINSSGVIYNLAASIGAEGRIITGNWTLSNGATGSERSDLKAQGPLSAQSSDFFAQPLDSLTFDDIQSDDSEFLLTYTTTVEESTQQLVLDAMNFPINDGTIAADNIVLRECQTIYQLRNGTGFLDPTGALADELVGQDAANATEIAIFLYKFKKGTLNSADLASVLGSAHRKKLADFLEREVIRLHGVTCASLNRQKRPLQLRSAKSEVIQSRSSESNNLESRSARSSVVVDENIDFGFEEQFGPDYKVLDDAFRSLAAGFQYKQIAASIELEMFSNSYATAEDLQAEVDLYASVLTIVYRRLGVAAILFRDADAQLAAMGISATTVNGNAFIDLQQEILNGDIDALEELEARPYLDITLEETQEVIDRIAEGDYPDTTGTDGMTMNRSMAELAYFAAVPITDASLTGQLVDDGSPSTSSGSASKFLGSTNIFALLTLLLFLLRLFHWRRPFAK